MATILSKGSNRYGISTFAGGKSGRAKSIRNYTGFAGQSMQPMQKITKLLALAGFVLGFATCASADITWNFDDVTFCLNCGQTDLLTNDITPTSWFTTNNAATTITGWDITVEGTNTQADNVYASSVPGNGFLFPDPDHLDFFSPGFAQFLDFFVAPPGITGAGGAVNLLAGDDGASGNSTIACNGCSTLVSGAITGTAVPEPRLGALLLIGLAGLGFVARSKFSSGRTQA
jgi:hypothetical protein